MPVRSRYQTRPIEPVKKLVIFTVRGSGQFPWDMLRYDSCWPAEETQTHHMLDSRGGARHVIMVGLREPTEGRWESFGWKIISG